MREFESGPWLGLDRGRSGLRRTIVSIVGAVDGVLVFFSFLFYVTDLLRDQLQVVLVGRVLNLELYK